MDKQTQSERETGAGRVAKSNGEEPIKTRVDFVLIFSSENANPNGDPGYDNRPRTDPYTGIGYVTDVCLKRKIRNRIEMLKEDDAKSGYDIWVRSGTYLRETLGDAIAEIREEEDYKEIDKKDGKALEKYERRRICEKFFDIRAFGGVLTGDSETGEEQSDGGKEAKQGRGGKSKSKVGQVRGPVSIQYAKSVVPITVEDDEITRVCPTKPDPKKPDKQTEMGRKKRVPFAVYVTKGSISPRLAQGEKGTGFSESDLEVLQEALKTLFVGDESTARPAGSMIVQRLVFFTHNSKDGDEPVHKTLERVNVRLSADFENKPERARSITDYEMTLDKSNLPTGTTVREML
jgi:CRISPR-associated protein Csd2